LSERKPGVLDELAKERKKLLAKESAELEQQAEKLAEEIKEMDGETGSRIELQSWLFRISRSAFEMSLVTSAATKES